MLDASTTQRLQDQLKKIWTTHHGRLLGLAALAGVFYLPAWLAEQWKSILSGGSSFLINVALLWLGFGQLWRHRENLRQRMASKDDRLAGHLLIVGGACWMPFVLHSVSLQALVWCLILVGVAWSSFGLGFFMSYAGSCLIIVMGIYPNATFLLDRMLYALFDPTWIADQVTLVSSQIFKLFGYGASVAGNVISINGESVLIGYPCTGVDMAIALAAMSFVVGLVFKQSMWRVGLATSLGFVVAMASNIPRVMLVVFAWAYWGPESFDFWHGPWGGQIFSTIMFTVAYYAVAPIYKIKQHRPG
jgi:exosortase/archaeosortase family protein